MLLAWGTLTDRLHAAASMPLQIATPYLKRIATATATLADALGHVPG